MSTIQDLAARSGDPFKDSPYFADAEPVLQQQWDYYVQPHVAGWDCSRTLEIASGHGRNAELLRKISNELIITDINPECIAACEQRFAGDDAVRCVQLDGSSLAPIESDSISLVYSFDSMVHFEPEVVESYVREFGRVLQKGGTGFIHHSNWTAGKGQHFQSQPHWRNYMTKGQFAAFCENAGLEVLEQKVIGWDESCGKPEDDLFVPEMDCITTFRK